MEKFWVVIRDRTETYISKRHASEDEAKAEAERLCKKENARFIVLKVSAYVEPQEPPIVWHNAG